eukprot:GHVS01033824.1.p2 GENE.GHVS01033824.1~~GHVS01033824.1.p2  ORF type:complete len:108 (-),score=3.09 GHVS01033824.1:735-1058(-)
MSTVLHIWVQRRVRTPLSELAACKFSEPFWECYDMARLEPLVHSRILQYTELVENTDLSPVMLFGSDQMKAVSCKSTFQQHRMSLHTAWERAASRCGSWGEACGEGP